MVVLLRISPDRDTLNASLPEARVAERGSNLLQRKRRLKAQ